jgi:hypothetical protein
MKSQGNVTKLDDPLIKFTRQWLDSLLGWEQLEHFLCIISYTYRNALNQTPKKPLAIFLVGPPDSGKSLLIDFWLPRIHGQTSASDAHRLLRGENGASSALKNYVCKLSDKDLGDNSDIRRVRAGILSLLADYTTGGKLMYENVTVEEVLNLFTFSSNPDGSVVGLLRGMSQSIRSKMAIYDCGLGLKKMNSRLVEKKDIAAPSRKLEEELPFFCSFLKNWENHKSGAAKRYQNDRFGVESYINPKLEGLVHDRFDEGVVYEALLDIDAQNLTASRLFDRVVKQRPSFAGIKPRGFLTILREFKKRYPALVQGEEYTTVDGKPKNSIFSVSGSAQKAEDAAQMAAEAAQKAADAAKLRQNPTKPTKGAKTKTASGNGKPEPVPSGAPNAKIEVNSASGAPAKTQDVAVEKPKL